MIRLQHIETEGPLPTSCFDIVNDEEKIGMVQIRHKPGGSASVPEDMRSHLYYEIEEFHRGKGYMKIIFPLIIEEAKKIGLQEFFATVYADNIASKKVIENNGGKLIKQTILEDGRIFFKYRLF
jgi:predicted acetyltransferase